MDGDLFAVGQCFFCYDVITFNPDTVPSTEGKPICEHCIRMINRARAACGWPLIDVPEGCYKAVEA